MRALRWLKWAGENVLALVVFVLATIVAMGVFFRYALNAPLAFTFELSILIFAWVIFLGAALAHANASHIHVDFVRERVSPGVYRMIAVLRELIVAGVSSYVAWFGFELAMRTRSEITSLDLSNRYLYLSMPVGFGLIASIAVVRAVRLAAGRIEVPTELREDAL